MAVVLQGADELMARFAAMEGTIVVASKAWQDDAVRLMRQRIHSPTGRMRRSIVGGSGAAGFDIKGLTGHRVGRQGVRGGAVYGNWRVTFIDKGTKAHDIEVRKAKGLVARKYPAGQRGTGTVYGRKAHNPGSRKRPFISRSARQALRENPPTKAMIELWNAAGGKGNLRTLGWKASALKRQARA